MLFIYIYIYINTRTGVSRVVTKTTGERRSGDGALYYTVIFIYAETITMASLSSQYKRQIKNTVNITIIIINIVCRFRIQRPRKK